MPKVVEYLTIKMGDLSDERLTEIGKASWTFCGTFTRTEQIALRNCEFVYALFTRLVNEYVPYYKAKSPKPPGRPKKDKPGRQIEEPVTEEPPEEDPTPLFELNTESR